MAGSLAFGPADPSPQRAATCFDAAAETIAIGRETTRGWVIETSTAEGPWQRVIGPVATRDALCPVLAAAPDGTAVVAAGARARARPPQVAIRPPGGTFGAPASVVAVQGQAGGAWDTTGSLLSSPVRYASNAKFAGGGIVWLEPDGYDRPGALRGVRPSVSRLTCPKDGATSASESSSPSPTAPATSGAGRSAYESGGAVVERHRLGGRLRDPQGLSLLALPDGRRALAWTNQDRFDEDAPARVHYAVEGAPAAPEPAAPRVSVGRARESALRPGQALTLPIRCSAACDLSVTLAADGAQAVERSLTRAGTVTVQLVPPNRAIAPVRPGPVRVTVRSSAPGARTAKRTIATPRLRRLPALPLPHIEAVRARRLSGGRVAVRWRMSSDARHTLLSVTGTRTHAEDQDDAPALDACGASGAGATASCSRTPLTRGGFTSRSCKLIGERKRSVTVRLR